MIDQCIYEVYKREEKVIIPNFGAIIHSGFSDEKNFNGLLNFDDGKVIREIQKQMFLSEEKAKDALEKYIKDITSKLDKGKSIFLGGIGYLSKDDNGDISILKGKSFVESTNKNEPSKDVLTGVDKDMEQTETSDSPPGEPEGSVLPNSIGDVNESFDQSENDEYIEDVIADAEGSNYIANEMETDDSLAPYDENEFENEDHEEDPESDHNKFKEKRALKVAVLVILLMVAMVATGFYYLNSFHGDETKSTRDQLRSQTEASTLKIVQAVTLKSDSAQSSLTPVASDQSPDFGSLKYTMRGNTENAAPSSVEENEAYSLILGSFKVESNADNYQQYLQSQGMEVVKFQGGDNFYFVGYEKIPGKSEAIRLLKEVREENPNAWIAVRD